MACSSRGMDQTILFCQNMGQTWCSISHPASPTKFSTRGWRQGTICSFHLISRTYLPLAELRTKHIENLKDKKEQMSWPKLFKQVTKICLDSAGLLLVLYTVPCFIILVNITLVILRLYTEEVIRTFVL